ncbi:nitroreductase [Ottowia sp.]|uniref:nitroreductase family protein n=1 Tax=Ottowia sp. TaxID=1898956 RepID=UPI002C9A48BA|nr:nitroreductase [Ottowia sp.]HOB65436.1 nitroreductase [Ottowia sp.]HPZ58369.1 nitroreductase [Ottowia sp.]HQD46478.1 nitroreductase [Ottowia sp.]
MEDPASTAKPADTPPALGHPRPPEVVELAHALIHTRQTILPKRLGDPGPDAAQAQAILGAAASAPDHHELLPWRFIVVPAGARDRLADVFATALVERDATATPQQIAQAREKAYRSPLLLLAVVRLRDDDAEIEPQERIVSAGCAVQNMLLMAHAQGFGGALTSGKALSSAPLRALFGLADDEQALCFVNIGSVIKAKPVRLRPVAAQYVSTLAV